MASQSDEHTDRRRHNAIVFAVAPDDDTRGAFEQRLPALDIETQIVTSASGAAHPTAEQRDRIALGCVVCGAGAEVAPTQRRVECLRADIGDTPIVLLETDDTFVDVDSAIAMGARNLIAMDNPDAVRARLDQALEAGRLRSQSAAAGRANNPMISQPASEPPGAEKSPAESGQVAADSDPPESAAASQPGPAVPQPAAAENKPQPAAADKRPTPSATARTQSAPDARIALHRYLEWRAAPQQDSAGAIVFVAVCNIGPLQERLGLAAADRLLQEAGFLLLEHTRGNDRCFRFNNGEYVFVVERAGEDELAAFADRLHARLLEAAFDDPGQPPRLAAAIRYARLGDAAQTPDQRLLAIVNATYAMRENGDWQCRAHRAAPSPPALDARARQWLPRLEHAWQHQRFRLVYQGVRSVSENGEVLYDTLLRYLDDRDHLIRASEFIPAAEQAGFTARLDRWVVEQSVAMIARRAAEGSPIAVFVKLSANTIAEQHEFCAWLGELLAARALDRWRLVFSLRVAQVQAQPSAAYRLASTLEELGVRTALTHYNTQPECEKVLARMPAAFIKLAPSYARQILEKDDLNPLRAIAARNRRREIPIVAEQIEDANSMARLWRAGIDYVQGIFVEPANLASGERAEV